MQIEQDKNEDDLEPVGTGLSGFLPKETDGEEEIPYEDGGVQNCWYDVRLSKEAVNRCWENIEMYGEKFAEIDENNHLPSDYRKSEFIGDEDNWIFENVLKEYSEKMYYEDWKNHYDVHIAKKYPPPKFKLGNFWVNYQNQTEFNPPHNHSGLYSFVIFMRIPTHWKEQHKLPMAINANNPCVSDFQLLQGSINSPILLSRNFFLCPEDEGRMLFFPAWLSHQVFPFYGTEETRITLSGNIFTEAYVEPRIEGVLAFEQNLNKKKKQIEIIKKTIKK
ncbi:uncharacterized protein METZ01_LOCUS162238 [marine metagenome]|uniref:Prolyl 4-hydroxylase alpha subunit Fe(2+) 2OG dioxygenase domain-containing protein n=1 Tax=marine metagenome TaxID=408172 RepID=A0A382B6Z9_9ZZZZ